MCLELNFTLEKCPHMSKYDFWDGQEHPIEILLFSSFEVSQDMRVTNFKTRFLKNGSSEHLRTNVPDLGSSSTLLGYKSPSYDFSKKFKVLLGRCALFLIHIIGYPSVYFPHETNTFARITLQHDCIGIEIAQYFSKCLCVSSAIQIQESNKTTKSSPTSSSLNTLNTNYLFLKPERSKTRQAMRANMLL